MYSIAELAEMLSVSYFSIYRLITNGTIAAIKVGAQYRISQEEVDRIKEYGTVRAGE